MISSSLKVLKNVPIFIVGGSDNDFARSAASTELHLAASAAATAAAPVIATAETAAFAVTAFASSAFGMTSLYLVTGNVFYLWRRASLRNTTMLDIFRIRMTREPGVSKGLFCLFLLAWQFLVALYPITELCARLGGYASFFYSYPKAHGGGYILEPLNVQHRPGNVRAKQQVRLDWHRFKYNTGEIGRDGYRHPPAVIRNLPHVDIPKKSIRHWPWRRCHRHSYDEKTSL